MIQSKNDTMFKNVKRQERNKRKARKKYLVSGKGNRPAIERAYEKAIGFIGEYDNGVIRGVAKSKVNGRCKGKIIIRATTKEVLKFVPNKIYGVKVEKVLDIPKHIPLAKKLDEVDLFIDD